MRRWRAAAAVLVVLATASACDPRGRDAAVVDGAAISTDTVAKISGDTEFLSAAGFGAPSDDPSVIDGSTARSVLQFLIVNAVVRHEIEVSGGTVGKPSQPASTPKMSKAAAAATDERAALSESFQATLATAEGTQRALSLAGRYAAAHSDEFGEVCLVGLLVGADQVGAVQAALASGQTAAQVVASGAQAQELGAGGTPTCVQRAQVGPDAMRQLLAVRKGAEAKVEVSLQQGTAVILAKVASSKASSRTEAFDELSAALKGQSALNTWVQLAVDAASIDVDSRYGSFDATTGAVIAPAAPLPSTIGA